MIFAVDFDGTIVEHDFPRIGAEKKNAIFVMKQLQLAGHHIIIWTCREHEYIDEMKEWFELHDFHPDAVNMNTDPEMDFALHKVLADVYIDDRSFPPFTNWNDVRDAFLTDEES